MFLRVNAAFALSLDEFRAAVIGRSPSRVLDALVRVTSISVEVLLFSLAIHWLERAVSVIFVLLGISADSVPRRGSLWLAATCVLRRRRRPSTATTTTVTQTTATRERRWLQQHWGHIHVHNLLHTLHITRTDL